jgi:hypothetical protein
LVLSLLFGIKSSIRPFLTDFELRAELYMPTVQKLYMPVEYQGREMSKQEAVSVILSEKEVELDQPASNYADQIVNGTFPESLGLKNQLRYLVASIKVVDEDKKRAKRQLVAILNGESPESVGHDDSEADQITEQESEDIMRGFGSFTEQKVQRGELLTMADFKRYAEKTGYPVQKVLFATDWRDSYLSDETIARRKKAKENLSYENP